ncbi:hypothetical protein V5P93_003966 [Actinokineospora auranticolor]|uniref:Uncharacterized protein n=1 Tax=Actinokineospora auranticolor TaxID=155976 RepID=A0A2S6GLY0_9PSEU|nr:hypothetical protein [Actinokineospora auranticolor]PPK66249.1 hypothetical protein CLV40_111213 [Actinokineospora auranticolor]
MNGKPVRRLPLRLTAGAIMLDSGFGEVDADRSVAEQVHGFGADAYPVLGELRPELFGKALSAAGIATGVALPVPVVPAAHTDTGLTAFTAGLIGMYLNAPGMRRLGSFRPTGQGTVPGQDVWLLDSGLSLTFDRQAWKGGTR